MTRHPIAPRPAETYRVVRTDAERERVLMEELPQVRYIARRIHERLPRHVPFEDLVHAGVLGLIDALNKFDLSRRVQFSSYAKFRIRGAILDSLRELDWSPRELRRQSRLIDSTYCQLSGKLGRAPNENEIAHEMGIQLGALQSLLADLDGLELGSLRVESHRDAARRADLTWNSIRVPVGSIAPQLITGFLIVRVGPHIGRLAGGRRWQTPNCQPEKHCQFQKRPDARK